ncbi:hypothetical protein L208DRAFT_1245591, partial [Tricholoma matsutake]
WCLFKKLGREEALQEAVFTVQGVLTEFQLPYGEDSKVHGFLPVVLTTLTMLSMHPSKYHFLQRSITVSGLDTLFFNNTVLAMNEIYGVFNHAFMQGALGPWNPTETDGPLIEASNWYFTLSRPGLHLESVPFQENIDPTSVLAKMLALSGACCVHTKYNEVEYFLCRFEVCQPQSFRKEDIVELQLSFVIVALKEDPQKGGKCKLLVVLQSMALLDAW